MAAVVTAAYLAAPAATEVLRGRVRDLHKLACRLAPSDPAAVLASRIVDAAGRVDLWSTVAEPVDYAAEAVIQAHGVLGWYIALLNDPAIDRPSHGGHTPRQHHLTALTRVATTLEAGSAALADIYNKAASAAALGVSGRYSGGWTPTQPDPVTPPPTPATTPPPAAPSESSFALAGVVIVAGLFLILVGFLFAKAISTSPDQPHALTVAVQTWSPR